VVTAVQSSSDCAPTLSPWRACAPAAFLLTRMRTNGLVDEPVAWQTVTFSVCVRSSGVLTTVGVPGATTVVGFVRSRSERSRSTRWPATAPVGVTTVSGLGVLATRLCSGVFAVSSRSPPPRPRLSSPARTTWLRA
jgi:hypothetical protein